MGTPHKQAALIKAWADGAKIQYFFQGRWFDVDTPIWNSRSKYRIKPDTLKYRVALMSDGEGYWTGVVNLNNRLPENSHFVRWLTDWVEVEI